MPRSETPRCRSCNAWLTPTQVERVSAEAEKMLNAGIQAYKQGDMTKASECLREGTRIDALAFSAEEAQRIAGTSSTTWLAARSLRICSIAATLWLRSFCSDPS